MKTKFVAILMIVALLGGCASGSFLCSKGPTIINGLQAVITQANGVIDLINSNYPGIIPPVAQSVLSAAQAAKDVAQMALSKACPTAAELVDAQKQMTDAQTLMTTAVKMGTMKLGK